MIIAGSGAVGAAETAVNPLLEKWGGPYHGVPAFDRYQVAQFEPALEAGMAEQLAEIDKIAGDPAAPTFENTIAALERAGRTLTRVVSVYGVWSSTLSTPEFQAVEQRWRRSSPRSRTGSPRTSRCSGGSTRSIRPARARV